MGTCLTPHDTLPTLEDEGWRALSGPDGADFYREHLTDDAVMILPGAGVLTRDDVLQAIASAPPWKWYRLEDVRVLSLTETSALVHYRVTAQREGQLAYTAHMSTGYVLQGDAWKIGFHQQTPVDA